MDWLLFYVKEALDLARKIEYISMLAEDTAREIVKNREAWTHYLNTTARLYKYPFQEQMLIYAQRPDATACASIEIWNGKMNCWVNKGAKGIALIDEDAPYPRLKYVFDVSDVHKARRIGRDPYLWKMGEEHENAVIERLEKIYGGTNTEHSFADRLLEIAERITFDTYEEIAGDLSYLAEGSFLDGLDDYSMKIHLRDTMQASISYTLLARCGIDTDAYMDNLNFEHIHEFSTLPVLSQLGTNTTELCKPVLMEIGKAIRAYDREIYQKGVANPARPRYNALKRESENETGISNETTQPPIEEKRQEEESNEHGIDVSEERRLLHPEYPDGRAAGDDPHKIRTDEEELSEGTQEGGLFGNAAVGQTDEPSAGDSGNGRAENGTSHEPDGERRGSDRGIESKRSDEMGADDEQHPAFGGGDGLSGTDLQLNSGAEKSDSQELPDFFTSIDRFGAVESEDVIRGLLCYDEFLKQKRPDIARTFVTEPDEEKRTAFIKKAYNSEYSEFDVGVHRVGYKAQEDGLVIWEGHYLSRSSESKLSWSLLRQLVDAYIEDNVYLIPGEDIDLLGPGGEAVQYQQLSLFPSMEEQIGNIAVDHADEAFTISKESAGSMENLISDEMVDYTLVSGGGERDSRARIFAKYQKGLDHETMAEFLKQEYRIGGKGFTFEGEPLCVWYDENGMNFARGTAARYEPMLTLSWKEVEESTHDLIDSGRYMEEAEMWHVPMQEKKELASKIYFFFRDEYGFMPEELTEKIYSYPKAEEELIGLLSTPEGIDKILFHMDQAIGEIERGEVETRFRLIYRPEDIRRSVSELKREGISYPAAERLEIPQETFITQDEIDYKLSRGSNISGGLFRIYEFFLHNQDKKEQANFLKNEYGIGGSAPGLVGVWHSYADFNAKGLRLSKGSIFEPSAKILLTWPKVAERIRKLMDTDRFLTPEAKEHYAQWKAEKEQKVLEQAKEKLQEEAGEPDTRIVVAVESTEDYSDPSVGFYTYHYQDGREGVRYRLVSMGEDGLLEVYPEKTKFFINAEAASEYVATHENEIKVIPYDDMVRMAGRNLGQQKEIEVEPERDDEPETKEQTETKQTPQTQRERLLACREAIEQTIAKKFDGARLQKDAAKEIIDVYGEEDVEFILATTLVHLEHDGRFSRENKAWARELVTEASEETRQFIVTSHPAVVDGFLNQTRRYLEQERFVDQSKEDTLELLEPDLETPDRKTEAEPEIDTSLAVNYQITNDALGSGSAREKFDRNVAAIITLQLIESEKRTAAPEEQEILARYVGWGGLSEAFDEKNSAWHDRYLELKSLLSEQEYNSARESTLNAHYTSPTIIRSIYAALKNMGFEKGNVLEPSMGIGNFFGMLPDNMQDSRLYGVELDSLTGRIARQLYPKAKIQVTGFEKTDYPNDFFDAVVGNVPFGQYKVADKPYDKHNFLIHDYFLAKSLDKVRSGGVIAVVTTKGTMDKKSPAVRKHLAQRAELLGAIRLPNTAFKENAGTEVTSDILFFKKRDRVMDLEPDWVYLGENADGIAMNQYFINHPEMIVGKMELVSGPYGMEPTCNPTQGKPFAEQLQEAVSHIHGRIESVGLDELEDDTEKATIPADPDVRNYSYTIVDGEVYYRENSIMKPVEMTDSMLERIKGMVDIRDATSAVINYQLEEYGETAIREKQAELSSLYDQFTKRFGLLNSQTNKRAFNQDSSYCLLCSLEVLNEEGTLKQKADMFTKRTIKKQEVVTTVDTPTEALAVSMSEKACVDIGYMASLLDGSGNYDRIVAELSGVIFKNPLSDLDDPYAGWETNDEYLSGNVREKLEIARLCAENHPEYAVNVAALEQVQPKMLDASEIEVRLGANWVDTRYINDFMHEVFETPQNKLGQDIIGVQYSEVTGQWNIKGKSADFGNPLTEMTYGTGRANAYKILEDSLNLRDSRIFDTVMEDGKEKRVLNKKETMLASQKQEAIREAYKDWVFRDADRRDVLCAKYNEIFNSNRPREYDGSHLTFPGMTPDITLRPHQNNAIAHQLYGNNTLLAHCVGAGKTFEMTAAAMECRRLGLSQKSLFVVPNHLTEQWAGDFLRLYPGANILAATKKDFEPANRKKFCSRIATGDYDAVIIGHSQFEKIPLSKERQLDMIERQIDEITMEIESLKASQGERYTIKQMEKTKKSLLVRLERLNDSSRKDDVVTFEQLGVDRLFVDESHNYKNLFLYTKMRNVAGIAQTEAQKSSDMFAKCQYLDEITGGKGITFATGTPISNSMTELYTNMRYLQYGTLQRLGLGHFDSWAASFGETITAIELAPEGTGYRAKTRFARFFNLPELISIFKESADIQTPDMLKLPVPEAVHENVVLKPSEHQQEMVKSLADRAEAVRNRMVDPSRDNMLKITNDGRKLALDQRLIDAMLPDETNSKVNECVDKAMRIWKQTESRKSAQLIFSDLSTPKNDGTFNVYHDIRDKLMEKGVPPEEIAFIHDANTETRKAELFAKVRSGQVRFLLGSTAKMGAGTNVQDRLVAEHHLDVPWRPSDIEQREGRIIRQGNENKKVHIFRYVTEGTFDSYSWQLIENKQKFISQIMTSKSPVRSCEDIDEASLTYAEVKALATGNPYIKEKMDLDIQVSKLKLLKANHTSQIYRLEDNIAKHYPKKISVLKERIAAYQIDAGHYREVKPVDKEIFAMKLGERVYTDRKEAGTALIAFCKQVKTPNVATPIGEYLGFKMSVNFDSFYHKFTLNLKGALTHSIEVGADALGNLTRINNALESMTEKMAQEQDALSNTEKQLENAKEEVTKPFPQEAELNEKMERLTTLNALLNMDEKGSGECLDEPEEGVDAAEQNTEGRTPQVAERKLSVMTGEAERKVSDARPSIMDKLAMYKEQSSRTAIEPNKVKEKAEVL